MQVHLPVHVIAGHDIVLHAVNAAFLDGQMRILDADGAQDPFHVEGAIARSGKIRIP